MNYKINKAVVTLVMLIAGVVGVSKLGILKSSYRDTPPNMIIIHDTVCGTVQQAENVLKDRGLAYHYVIDKDGIIHEYVDPKRLAHHALGWSYTTIGISANAGGKYGLVNEKQKQAIIELSKALRKKFPTIKYVTGHRDASKSGKIDPEVPGKYSDWMLDIQKATGLKYLNKENLWKAR